MEELNERLINYLLDEIRNKDKELREAKESITAFQGTQLWMSKEIDGLKKTIENLKEKEETE